MLTSQQNECDKHLKNHLRWGLVRQTNLSAARVKVWGFLLCWHSWNPELLWLGSFLKRA